MKTLLTLPLLLLSLISFTSWSETMDDLVETDGIHYKKFTEIPFTGQVKGRHQGSYKDGRREGSWVVYYENGRLAYKGDYKNGEKVGSWVSYYEDGRLAYKGDYKNGKKEGRWVSYTKYGIPQPNRSGVFKDGVKISD